MRLLPILLLCFHYLQGSAIVIDADCNDENVFNAVDEALRSFNNAKEDGNQFILHRITDAKIKNEEDGQIHHFIEYETHESSCEVKSGKSWQKCSPTYAHRAKCSAHVIFNKEQKIRSVESQNCSSLKAIDEPPVTTVDHPCLGCPKPIDKENKELLCFVHSTIEHVNRDANHPFYFDLESVVNATRQVVFGWKYHIQFHIRQTNCSKYNFTSKDSKECKIDKGGESFECTAHVDVTPDGTVKYPFLECKSNIGICINCPIAVHNQDPQLKTLLVQVMDEYNFNSNHTELYDVAYVSTAVKKGFQRELYEINFVIGPTNCSKLDYSILGPECDLNENKAYARLSCETKINVTDKTITVHSTPSCYEVVEMYSLRFGGWSPLRISRSIDHEENDRNNMLTFFKPVKRIGQPGPERHVHNHNKGHKHGKKGKKDKGENNKHKHQHQDSSEEDNENEVTPAPAVPEASEVSNNQEMSPNADQTFVLDFPLRPTDVVPRCPGRVWQPISLSPTENTFSDTDLLDFSSDKNTE